MRKLGKAKMNLYGLTSCRFWFPVSWFPVSWIWWVRRILWREMAITGIRSFCYNQMSCWKRLQSRWTGVTIGSSSLGVPSKFPMPSWTSFYVWCMWDVVVHAGYGSFSYLSCPLYLWWRWKTPLDDQAVEELSQHFKLTDLKEHFSRIRAAVTKQIGEKMARDKWPPWPQQRYE
jgi:hypothetical protein